MEAVETSLWSLITTWQGITLVVLLALTCAVLSGRPRASGRWR